MKTLIHSIKNISAVKNILTQCRRIGGLICIVLLLAPSVSVADGFDHQHSKWTQLLQKHILVINEGQSSQVDYAGFKRDSVTLKTYLNDLSRVSQQQFNLFGKNQQQAFLINAYNAYTIDLVLAAYPKLDSIRDLGSLLSSPWKKEFVPLLGDVLSLDDIEHGQLRTDGRYDEPRVHFAVNCASIGCPPLREEAFIGDRLNEQLDEQAIRFLSDHSRNRFDRKENVLMVSKIFDWYGGDFEKGYLGIDTLEDFFAKYADQLTDDSLAKVMIRKKEVDIEFLDYDWTLNDQQ